ncbi:MAG: LacI family DNA-binding transcriptional regulator [Actinomycetaceae bacterium]|nr:LacI family DNA-binding transcriptional regulator [Actinomycetaceae bacterium]
MARPTIRDIAAVAGVSPAAVSFALNSRPGISAATRERILEVANQMGWTPNAAARALSASRAHAVGLVIERPQTSYSSERFFFDLMVGIQSRLKRAELDLVLQMVQTLDEEMDTYRAWYSQKRVDGVIVVNPRSNDPRTVVLGELGLPAVFIGEPAQGFGSVVSNDSAMMRTLAEHLMEAGARRIAYLCGSGSLVHIQRRQRTLSRFGAQHGVDVVIASETDYTERSAQAETTQLLRSPARPDAIIFDNEVLALGGTQAITATGLKVGIDVITASCEDSPICRVLNPPITSIARSPAAMGEHAAQLLVSMLEGESARNFAEDVPRLVVRESSQLITQSSE